MAEIYRIPNHTENVLGDLPSVFADAENFRALLSVFADMIQDFENLAFDVYQQFFWDQAAGAQLDQLGLIVGEARGGLSDADYRGFIIARILTNRSCGEIPRIIDIAQRISGATKVRYFPVYPAGYQLEIFRDEAMSSALATRVHNQILDATAAGVGVDISEVVGDGYFGFAEDPDALGFGEAGDADEGGYLTDLI